MNNSELPYEHVDLRKEVPTVPDYTVVLTHLQKILHFNTMFTDQDCVEWEFSPFEDVVPPNDWTIHSEDATKKYYFRSPDGKEHF